MLKAVDEVPGYSGFRRGHVGQVYNEAAFRHFLAVDWWRAARTRRSLFLVLVTVRQRGGSIVKLTDTTAAALFGGLVACVREVDFVGWYREGYVAAAVLAQGSKSSVDDRQLIEERIRLALRPRLFPDEAWNLRVRVVRLNDRVRRRFSDGV